MVEMVSPLPLFATSSQPGPKWGQFSFEGESWQLCSRTSQTAGVGVGSHFGVHALTSQTLQTQCPNEKCCPAQSYTAMNSGLPHPIREKPGMYLGFPCAHQTVRCGVKSHAS